MVGVDICLPNLNCADNIRQRRQNVNGGLLTDSEVRYFRNSMR